MGTAITTIETNRAARDDRGPARAVASDTGLTTGPGWDNVTGLGVPDGAAFVNEIAQQ